MEARPIPDSLKVQAITQDGWLTLTCDDYDHYRSLPGAVEFRGRRYQKGGWNSDFGIVMYRPGTDMTAIGVKP